MKTALSLAALFALIGGVLLRSALASLASGVAETDEHGSLWRQREPIRFGVFVATQFLFGGLALAAGILLAAATLMDW